jgi:molecular chaperone DnaK
MSKDLVVGIDLGTTYSAIAYINQHGKPEIIPNREGERITPSVVLFDGDTPIVGSIAKRSAAANPLNVCQFVKRQMGEPDWRFLTQDDKEYTPEEISAFILKRLKEDAEAALDQPVVNAVITVPAYFNDAQRKATQDAGKIAGLNVLRIVNEPTAAALAYGADKTEDQTIMVYDLGGGTFDVTIMRVAANEIEVISTGGDKNLGGFDWDNKLMQFLNDAFKKEGGPDLLEDLALTQDLRDKAEIAKKTLSSRDNTKLFLSAGGKNASIPLSRANFEEAAAELFARTENLMTMTLEDAKMTWSDIDKVLLVGGSTRMKGIPALIEKISGKKPSIELHPDEIVAMGAALLGGVMQKQAAIATGGLPGVSAPPPAHLAALPDVCITDVNSHSLGVIAVDVATGKNYNSIILPKDTAIPTRASNVYSTMVDNQTGVQVEVTEGEDEDPAYVRIIGKGSMRIPPYSKGALVEIFFQYDNNGIVHVTVFDKTANKMLGEMFIERKSNRTDAEIDRMTQSIAKIEIQ